MIKFLIPTLSVAAMPSMRLVLSAAPSWRHADGPLAAQAGKAMTAEVARKRIAPAGAPAYAHVVCAAQHTSLVMGEVSLSVAESANAVDSFGTQVQTQLSVDATRVDGRAGSPPRGAPV